MRMTVLPSSSYLVHSLPSLPFYLSCLAPLFLLVITMCNFLLCPCATASPLCIFPINSGAVQHVKEGGAVLYTWPFLDSCYQPGVAPCTLQDPWPLSKELVHALHGERLPCHLISVPTIGCRTIGENKVRAISTSTSHVVVCIYAFLKKK